MSSEQFLQQIEELREQINQQYKRYPVITPELIELSEKLDELLNKFQHHTFDCT